MSSFELILDHGYPAAALVSPDITDRQLWNIYSLLPAGAYAQPELAARWEVDRVLATDDWRQAQLPPQTHAQTQRHPSPIPMTRFGVRRSRGAFPQLP